MIIYPVKIYRPNEHGDLEYVKTVYPEVLAKIHWDRFNRDTGQLNLRSKYPRGDQSHEDTQMEE